MLTADDKATQEKILRCLRTEDGKILLEKITELNQRATQQLKSARDLVDIHRWQGRIEAFETILKFREE